MPQRLSAQQKVRRQEGVTVLNDKSINWRTCHCKSLWIKHSLIGFQTDQGIFPFDIFMFSDETAC